MKPTLASISLFPATREQTIESRRRSFVAWGADLSLEQFLARDARMDTFEQAIGGRFITWVLAPRDDPHTLDFFCSCESFRRDAVVWEGGVPRQVTGYGIASVFTSPSQRGHGYARHMMRLLHWVLADASRLPEKFPVEWGVAPARVPDAGDGWFSALWSDVGSDFYRLAGPTPDSEGWIVRDAKSTLWDVSSLKAPNTEDGQWTWLGEEELLEAWDQDARNIASKKRPSQSPLSFAFLPSLGVAAFQHRRLKHYLEADGLQVTRWGIVRRGADVTITDALSSADTTFASWMFELRTNPKTLLITRLVSSEEQFPILLGLIMQEAQRYNFSRLEVYNLPNHLQTIAGSLGGKTIERGEHLPAFKWYGPESNHDIEWRLNESEPPIMHRGTKRSVRSPGHILAFALILALCWYWKSRPLSNDFSYGHDTTFQVLAPDGLAQFELPNGHRDSLSVVLPVTSDSLSALQKNLDSLLESSSVVQEIIIICSPSLVKAARTVAKTYASVHEGELDIVISPLIGGLDYNTGILDAASHAISDWILLLDQHGLLDEGPRARELLLRPPAVSLPFGLRGCGVFRNHTYLTESTPLFYAQRLHLPFMVPSYLTSLDPDNTISILDTWSEISSRLVEGRHEWTGGLVLDPGYSQVTCLSPPYAEQGSTGRSGGPSHASSSMQHFRLLVSDVMPGILPVFTDQILFRVDLPFIDDLKSLAPTLCMMQDKGHSVYSFISELPNIKSGHPPFVSGNPDIMTLRVSNCTLMYFQTSGSEVAWTGWNHHLPRLPDVLFLLEGRDGPLPASDSPHEDQTEVVIVRLRRSELPHTLWMATLPLEAWLNWHRPRIDISIITNNRPHSLSRLLKSLSESLFYGDSVDIQLHLEQTADQETLEISRNLSWPYGDVHEHHRIFHGGLMAAVVESWYPHTNNTYGLLLEDDTEVSPLFYAWIKMNILKYRYGKLSDRSSKVFGLSLYQQKVIELRPEGRREFDAKSMLKQDGRYDPISPYLSPIPCSWGAVYFPEHWRDFHLYTVKRLSEKRAKLSDVVVPGIRSNNWTKSWKKYFIEFAFLRGLVMIYPNFPNYVSLSTNHLELGSHVKARTAAKKDLFLLPLMQLPRYEGDEHLPGGMLSLPHQALPGFKSLPVFNLTGDFTSLVDLEEQGRLRCKELDWCNLGTI